VNLTRAQQLLVGLAILAILAGVAAGIHGRRIKAKASDSSEVYTAPPQPAVSATITVQVSGAVREPGLKVLRRGARVDDAIRAAGGPSAGADMTEVNLAAPIDDGQRIDVPSLSAPAAPSSKAEPSPPPGVASPPARPVNLNTATTEELEALPGLGPALAQAIVDHRRRLGGFRRVEELEALPGLGPALAQAIVDHRRRLGGFRRVEDLESVPGIGPKRLADLRPYLFVQ